MKLTKISKSSGITLLGCRLLKDIVSKFLEPVKPLLECFPSIQSAICLVQYKQKIQNLEIQAWRQNS